LPDILAKRTDLLSPRMLRVIEDLSGDWRRLDERIENLSREIETLACQDKGCERLMTVPGIGPIISSAIVAAIGTGDAFSKGRDFGAWLGLVPKQMSNRRSHDPWQHLEARQSLSTHAVRSGSLGRVGQGRAQAMGALWPQVVDRGSQKTTAPQRAGDCARQQTRPHRLDGSP